MDHYGRRRTDNHEGTERMETNRNAIRILVAECEAGVRNLISLALKRQGYSPDFADDELDVDTLLCEVAYRYSAILVDLAAPDAYDLLERARVVQLPVIGLSNGTPALMESAAVDEIVAKPFSGEALCRAIQRCLRKRSDSLVIDVGRPEGGASASVWLTEMQSVICNVAAADVPVLVRGETGVGKEVLARQIHSLSPRAKKPFLKVNCAALPSELIESELFGYERGAFTGAFKSTPGKFEMADGGTILLDEIGDMDFKLQAKLLQVLQDSEFIRLGSSEPRRVDVRVIAATHCDLEQGIAENRFREDLYYRLNIITFHVPALRDRKDEILPLAYHFIRKHSVANLPTVELTPMLCEALVSHDWPGNIRELENVIRRLLVLRRPDSIAQDLRSRARTRKAAPTPTNHDVHDVNDAVISLPKPVREIRQEEEPDPAARSIAIATPGQHERTTALEANPGRNGSPQRMPTSLGDAGGRSILERVDRARRQAETEAILTALNSTLWNRRRAAELLNIDYKALLYKMKKLDIVERAAQIAI